MVRTVELSDYPGRIFVNIGGGTTDQHAAELANLGLDSPGFDALAELKAKFPELQEREEFQEHLEELGYDGLTVVAGLDSADSYVHCVDFYPNTSGHWASHRNSRWRSHIWFLGITRKQLAPSGV